MELFAPVNKIIPFSLVDGPGSRCSVFLQGCNVACVYCHNPETQGLCRNCGECVAVCPADALTQIGCHVAWDKDVCVQCDNCIRACRHHASPKVRWMTPSEVAEIIESYQPFIRGITVSGGECMMHPEWMARLFERCHERGLTALVDSNGFVPFSEHPDLLDACDGVMLDVKAWDEQVCDRLTMRGDVSVVKENLALLAERDKIEELRIVVVDGWNDPEDTIAGIAGLLGEKLVSTRLKLIRFRNFGVQGELADAPSPSEARIS